MNVKQNAQFDASDGLFCHGTTRDNKQ